MANKEKLINKIYTDAKNPGGFGGLNRLYAEAKKHDSNITKNDVVTFLEGNRTYTLFKDRRINYERSKIIPAGFLSDLHVDLGDFQSLSGQTKAIDHAGCR